MTVRWEGRGLCEILLDHEVGSHFATCDREALVLMHDRGTNGSLAVCQIHALSLLDAAKEAQMGQFGEAQGVDRATEEHP